MLKKILKVFLFIVLGLMIFAMLYIIYLRVMAIEVGKNTGTEAGYLVGRALGSWEGMTQGRIEGLEAGKAAGLSAEDTVVNVETKMQQMNNLEVLVASVKMSDIHIIGEKTDYAALYLANGNIVFSVDMSKAVVTYSGNEMKITLPEPKAALYIDQSSVEKVAEYQKHYFSGSAEDGFDAYLNSMQKISEASAETISNYDELIISAKESAEKQVKMLAQSASVNFDTINVLWCD